MNSNFGNDGNTIFRQVLNRIKEGDINALNPDGDALLHVVVKEEKELTVNLVKELLDHGADINVQGYYENTVLHYAIGSKNPALVRYLINKGADVNLRNQNLDSPLHYAVWAEEKEIIEMLLEAGADINAKDSNDQTPIFWACGGESWGKSKRTKKDFNLDIMELLVDRGADFNLKNKKGIQILHEACKRGLPNVVKFLVDHGADLHSKVKNDVTTLHEAVLGNNFDLIELLLANNLDIDVRDKRGETPLHHLVILNHGSDYVDMVEFLIDNGADVDAQDGNCVTPLEKAVYLNLPEVSECLLDFKASIEYRKDVILFSYYLPPGPVPTSKNGTEIATLRLMTAFMATKKDDISSYINAISREDAVHFQWVESLFQKCKLEVEYMKKRSICEERRVSFFDILTKDLFQVAILARSEEIMKILEFGKYKEEFPSYEYLLEKRIRRLKKLLFYMQRIRHFLEEYAEMSLPIIVLDNIFTFLEAGDIRNFGRVLCSRAKTSD